MISFQNRKRMGYTLIELLIVIAIIMLLSLMAMNFNFNRKTASEQRDRLAESIRTTLYDARTNALIGRWVYINGTGNSVNPTTTRIAVNTGGLVVTYFSGATQLGTGAILTTPFYNLPYYAIAGVTLVARDESTFAADSTFALLINDSGDMSFTGLAGTGATAIRLRVTASYKTLKRDVELDRRTGAIRLLAPQ